MSKVKLRSRSYKLSRADLSNICSLNKSRHKLRCNESLIKTNPIMVTDCVPCKDQLTKSESLANITHINDNKLMSPIIDKSFESSSAETSSLESQSTSQLSSGLSLECVDFCKWKQCRLDLLSCDHPLYNQPKTLIADELEHHLMDYHVKTQLSTKRKFFECLWVGCKVFKKKSLSYSWLERHIIEHTDNRNKPFSCIFECSMRFSSQALLEKHVQSHIIELNQTGVNDQPINLGRDINLNFRPKKSCLHNKKPYNHQTSYHVHRGDFIDKNSLAQIQTNTHLQTVTIDPVVLSEYGLDSLIDQPLPAEVIRLMTHEFKIMGKRKPSNKITQTLVQWVLPYKLKSHTEWINDNFMRLAEYLSVNQSAS